METPPQHTPGEPNRSDGPQKTVYVLHGQELASRRRRLGALAIDSVIVGLIVLMLFGVVVAGEDSQIPAQSAGLLTAAFLVFYHILMWTAFSATPGKMMLKLQIVDRNGWRIGIVPSFGRLIGYGISALFVGLGFVWIFVHRFGRGWHDFIAGTYVVYLGHEDTRSRNMAGDFFQDLAGGPPSKRDFAEYGSAQAERSRPSTGGQGRLSTNVRVVDVDNVMQTGVNRPAIGDYPVAEFWRRAIAFGIDLVVSLIASIAALFILSIWIPQTPEGLTGDDIARQEAIRTSIIVALIFGYLVYPVISNWAFKSTAGKRTMNLQVVDSDGRNVGLSRSILRHISYAASAAILLMGFITVMLDGYSQSWHDKIAKTYVTYTGNGRISDQTQAQRPRKTEDRPRRTHWPTE